MAKQEDQAAELAVWSLCFNIVQTLLKLAAAAITLSVSLLSEAIHSTIDVLGSTITYFGIRAASRPADDEHQFGHGKIESLASFAEAVLIALTTLYIIQDAVKHLIYRHEAQQLDVGLAVLSVTSITGILLALKLKKGAQQTGSVALRAEAKHLATDFVTSAGVWVALLVEKLAGWHQADPVVALLLSVYLLFSAHRLGMEAVHQLVDHRVADDEVQTIKTILAAEKEMLSYHNLRTRQAGNLRYVELHAVVPRDWDVVQAHDLADRLETKIELALQPCNAFIHIDPFDEAKARKKG